MTTPRIEGINGHRIIEKDETIKVYRGEVVLPLSAFNEALTEAHQAGIDEAVGILKQIEYDVDVDKKPTIAEEAWANQYESKTEAFWYGECEGLKVFKKAIECIEALQDNK